jgi:hypothetical protein
LGAVRSSILETGFLQMGQSMIPPGIALYFADLLSLPGEAGAGLASVAALGAAGLASPAGFGVESAAALPPPAVDSFAGADALASALAAVL